MDKHYGQIVELTIRKQGFSISELARLANINRKCVYNWFNQKYLKPEIIHRVGVFIKHDFSVEFPELFTTEDFLPVEKLKIGFSQPFNEPESEKVWKDRYIDLLEKYNQLLLEQYERNM
nr:helix-turn-helix domain-containing protein [uncultured Mucilaginibacter sp.]